MPGFSLPILLRAVAVWLLIIAVESAQGAVRHVLTSPQVEFAVRQISVITGALAIFAISWLCARWMRTRTAAGALGIGLLWVGLTLGFELVVGRALGLPWPRMLEDYDLLHGGLMPLGLLAMALTPWAVRHLKARGASAS